MTGWGPAIDARPALRTERARLLELLRGLGPDDWHRPTVCGPWLVRDVVAHLLGDDLSRLSRSRDLYDSPGPSDPAEPLPALIARLNDRWVTACGLLSPAVLVDQLAAATPAVLSFWDGLDLDVLGEPVTWAGPRPAPRWLDCARDFTEYWTHHRQIRDALGADREDDAATDHTALDTFLRAVPHTLRDVEADRGDTVTIIVEGPPGGRWSWRCVDDRWTWQDGHPSEPTAAVTITDDALWRLCTRGISPARARSLSSVSGRRALGDAVLDIVSIIY